MRSNSKGSVRNHTFKSLASKRGSARSIFVVRALLVLLFFSILLPAPDSIMPNRVLADPGDLVPSFGAGGVVKTDFASGNDSAQAISTNLFGKIIAAGSATIPGRGTDFALACYDRNGNLDPSFGNGGKVTVDFFGANDGARGAVVQEDGMIVLSGFATNGSERQWAFARFTFDGQLDSTFGQGGKVVLDLGSTSEAFKAVVQQPDGKIVAAGDSRLQNSLDFTVVRLNPSDGSLDNSFGNNGVVRVDFGFIDRAIDLAIDEKNIFVGGVVVKTATDSDFGIARLNISNGSLNNDFDGDGKLTVDYFGKQDGAQSIILRGPTFDIREEHLVVGGFATNETSDFALAAYNYDGLPFPNFFKNNKETTDFKNSRDLAFDVIDLPDGNIAAAGWAGDGDRFDLGVAQWDYKPTTKRWEFSGRYTQDTSSGANNVAFDALIYEDTITTAGTGLNLATGNDDFILTQHENEKFFEFTKTVSPNPAVRGDIVTYTFTVKNLHDSGLSFRVFDSLPTGITPLLENDPDWRSYSTETRLLLSIVFEVPGGETRQITLRARADQTGFMMNNALFEWQQFSFFGFHFAGEAEVSLEVKEPEITDVKQTGKKLTVTGLFGSSSGANQSSSIEASDIEPQASCPVILIDGQEQKTKRDAVNPTTVLIAKKGGKKIAPGQTVTLKVRLCDGTETADFVYTRPQ